MNIYLWSLFCFFSQVCKQFTEAGFMADADLDSGCLLNKKIRNAQLAQYNFILGKNILLPWVHFWLMTEHWFKSIFTQFLLLSGLPAITSVYILTSNSHVSFWKTILVAFEICSHFFSPCYTDYIIHLFEVVFFYISAAARCRHRTMISVAINLKSLEDFSFIQFVINFSFLCM